MFLSKKILFLFFIVTFVLILVVFLYVYDTRYYLFKKYEGKVSAETEIGEIYAYNDINEWRNISDSRPKLTEVMCTGFCVALHTEILPDEASVSLKIIRTQSNKVAFQNSGTLNMTSMQSSSKYRGRIVFKDIGIPFEDITVEVAIKVIKDGVEKSVFRTFKFKAVQKFEHHFDTIYTMMSV